MKNKKIALERMMDILTIAGILGLLALGLALYSSNQKLIDARLDLVNQPEIQEPVFYNSFDECVLGSIKDTQTVYYCEKGECSCYWENTAGNRIGWYYPDQNNTTITWGEQQ